MGSKSAPPAPNYESAAREQAAASKDLTAQQNWANRPNQNTPWGSTSWGTQQTIDPGTGLPVTQWTQTQALDPKLQGALDQQLALQQQRSNMAGSFMGRVQQDMGNQPFNWNAINAQTPMGRAINPNIFGSGTIGAQTGVQQQQFDTSAPQKTSYGNERISATGQDISKLPTTTQTTNQANFVDERHRIEDSLFNRMQPEHDRQTDQLRTQLANQGLTPGSEAFNQEMQRMSDQQARERFNALQQGGQEQQSLQNMLMGQQQQAFGQSKDSQAAQNQALQQLFQQYQAVGQFGLGAGQQGFAQNIAAQQAQNAAKQAAFQQSLAAGQFANQGMQQEYAQQLGANAQNFTQMMNASQYQNQLRQQAIAEEAQRRNMSLNEMNALLTGQQVQAPNMPGFNSAQRADTPDLLRAAGLTGQSQLDAFNTQQQGMQGMMSGLMGLGSGAMMM